MSIITVEINNPTNVKRFISILEDLKYVKSFIPDSIENKNLTPLTEVDWIKPGRPATDEEFEQLAIDMEQDEGGYNSEIALEMTLKEIREWGK